jgi:hypothetical protein
MDTATLDKQTSDKVSFVTFIIEKFASTFKMNRQDAYFYLKKYGGIDYISKHWWALHIDNPACVLREIHDICYKNGGIR